jgi:hypothetical protein
MAGGMSSGSISTVYVYPQDSEPATKRPGVLWVDTSVSPPDTKAYDENTDVWESVAPGNVTISDSQPTGKNEGHIWVDTSVAPADIKTLSGGTWTPYANESEVPGLVRTVIASGSVNIDNTDQHTITKAFGGDIYLYRLFDDSSEDLLYTGSSEPTVVQWVDNGQFEIIEFQ